MGFSKLQIRNKMKNIVKKYIPLFLIPVTLLFLQTNCKKEDTNNSPTQNHKVLLTPESFDVNNNAELKVLMSCNPPLNGEWKAYISEDDEWLTISPEAGTINSDIVEITLTTDTSKAKYGYNSSTVSFVVNGVYTNNTYVYLVKTDAITEISLTPQELIFDYGQDKNNFFIKNTGNQEISWSIDEVPNQLSFSNTSGTIAIGDSVGIEVGVDRSNMETGEFDFPIRLLTESSYIDSLNVKVLNYNDELTLLPFNIENACYIKSSNKIALIVYDPLKFMIMDPETLETDELIISKIPKHFSVEPSGNYSVLGFSDKLVVINNSTMSVVNEIPLENELYSVVMKNSEWDYVFPAYIEGVWQYYLQSVNLSTGEIFISSFQVNNSQFAVLHPSGNYIYSKPNNSSSGSYTKFSVQNENVEIINEVVNNNLSSYGNLWITTDGDRLFTGSGLILRLSENPEQDLTYGGYISDEGYLISYDESPGNNLIFSLYSTEEIAQKLFVYTLDYVEPVDTLNLPFFFIPESPYGGKTYYSEGKYVFVNEDINKVYILQKAEENYPVYNEWAMATFGINNLKNK